MYLPGCGEGGSSFGVLPFSVPVVVLLSLLVKDVCDSLLGNPSLVKEKWRIVTMMCTWWVVLRGKSITEILRFLFSQSERYGRFIN